jgi:TonB family protein
VWRAAALSLAVHAVLLLALSLRVGRVTLPDADVVSLAIPVEVAAVAGASGPEPMQAASVEVDVTSVPPEPPAPEPVIVPELPDLPPADQEKLVEHQTAPQAGTTAAPGAAAPDRGAEVGRRVPVAFRRDSSTLHARQGDGAEVYQISREQTGRRSSSPQPIRQEPLVGARDSAATRQPRPPAVEATPPPTAPPEAAGALDPAVTVAPDQLPPADPGADPARGDGPLDTEKGTRRFDVAIEGPARDNLAARAASNEAHPGRMELSSPSAAGPVNGASGRGPGDAPGVVSRPTSGSAPAIYGGPASLERGDQLAMSTAEREYNRYQAEIRRRVASMLRFPKHLALMLEQGETVVHFVVRADGRLAGSVQVVKSAGFDEFDAEAVRAVTRAAPFPRMSRTMGFSMPIAFDNPVVR